MTRVSIGLPVFNGEQFVGHAIQSVLNQTFSDWELIVSDNASTDGTQRICEHFARADSRIKYLRSPENRGAAWNFNEVFHQSSGEYFRWLSHDDYLMPEVIAKCVSVLDESPGYIGCATATGAIDESGLRILDNGEDDSDLRCQGLTTESERERLRFAQMDQPSRRYFGILMYSRRCNEIYGLMRREIMAATQLHPAYCGGDKVLLAELALRGKIAELPEMLFYVRWHDTRFTSNSSTKEQDEHMATDRSHRFVLPHQYRATLGYLNLMRRVPMSNLERLRCLAYWIRFTLQVSKWTSILKNTFNGKATWVEIQGQTKRGERIHLEHGSEHDRRPLQSV